MLPLIMYIMGGNALNIPTGREIRQNNREQRKNTIQQKLDREIRMDRRNEMRTNATSEVANEINSMTTRNIPRRSCRQSSSSW